MCVCVCVWYYPFGQPRLINFFKPILFMASDSSSGFRRGISHFFTATKNTTERVGEKEQTNNMDVGQLQAQEREFVWRFCAAFRAFVDYLERVFFAKLLQKPLGMSTHLWLSSVTASLSWPSFLWTAISHRLVSSALRCRLLSLDYFVN